MLFCKPAILLAQSWLLLSDLGDANGKIWKETRQDVLQTGVLIYNQKHVFHPDWLHSTQNILFVRRYDLVDTKAADPNLTSSFSRWKKASGPTLSHPFFASAYFPVYCNWSYVKLYIKFLIDCISNCEQGKWPHATPPNCFREGLFCSK